jgi:hypothetical protein
MSGKRIARDAPLFGIYWVTARGPRRHPVGIYRARGSALRSIGIAGARNSNRCLTGRSSWVGRLGLARDRLTILSVWFLYTRILGVRTCTDQYRCRRQSYYPFHRMPPLSVSIQLWRRQKVPTWVTSRLSLWGVSRGATAVSACPFRSARHPVSSSAAQRPSPAETPCLGQLPHRICLCRCEARGVGRLDLAIRVRMR